MRTPGVVATFFHRLLQQPGGTFYPQRYMLWFVNFEPQETSYAKVLLAFSRMPRHRDPSIQAFIESYAETFPADERSLRLLVDQVFGPCE